MSALFTHAAAGLLLGVGLRLPLRYLPLAAFLAAAPDIDHFAEYTPIPFGESRVTFHNVFVLVALPLLVYAVLTWRNARPEWRQMAGAAPVLLSSHLLLDLLPLDPLGGGGWAALFWPLDPTRFTLPYFGIRPRDPTTFSTFTLLLVFLSGLALLAVLAHRWSAERPRAPRVARTVVGAYAATWLLLVAGLAAGGAFIEKPDHPNAFLTLSEPRVSFPESRLTASVFHHGGDAAGQGLRVELWSPDGLVAAAASPRALKAGDRWDVDLPLPPGTRAHDRLDARLVSPRQTHTYAAHPADVVRGHAPTTLSLASLRVDGTAWVVTLQNVGDAPVPPNAVRLLVQGQGVPPAEVENERRWSPGETWTVTLRPPAASLARPLTLEVRAVDDAHAYLRETRTPTLGG